MTTPNEPKAYEFLTAEAEKAGARSILSAPAFEFIDGAAHHGEAKDRNELAWDATLLTPRLPVDVSGRTTEATMWGQPVKAPIAVAPVGLPAEVRNDGDLEIARACAQVGVPYVLPTMASAPLEEVAAVEGLISAFQLYWLSDQNVRMQLLDRAQAAGCKAIIVTVDAPGRLGSYDEKWLEYSPRDGVTYANLPEGMSPEIDGSLDWDGIESVVDRVDLPVYVKGVLSPHVAKQAVSHGCAGVIVSNHSGRQLDAAPDVAGVLPEVANAIPKHEVLADSGLRTGTDVLRALALGADSVLVGRQVMYGLAAAGSTGVAGVLNRLIGELDAAMANTGCPTVRQAIGLTGAGG